MDNETKLNRTEYYHKLICIRLILNSMPTTSTTWLILEKVEEEIADISLLLTDQY